MRSTIRDTSTNLLFGKYCISGNKNLAGRILSIPTTAPSGITLDSVSIGLSVSEYTTFSKPKSFSIGNRALTKSLWLPFSSSNTA